MEVVFTPGRTLEINNMLCIFCQTLDKSKDALRVATDYSRNVGDVTVKRKKYSQEVIDRLECVLERSYISILWHSNCYAQYTNKDKIERLPQKFLNVSTSVKKITKPLPFLVLPAVRLSQYIRTNTYFGKRKALKEGLSAVNDLKN